jgi:hypothetical protein
LQFGCCISDAFSISFNLFIHPDHKYKWLRGGDLNH